MKLSLLEDGTLVDGGGAAFGRLASIEVELFTPAVPLTPAEIRDLTDCPFCGAERGNHCRRWRGSDRKQNHAERVKIALALADLLDEGGTVSERSERYGDSVVSLTENVLGTTRNLPSEVKERRPTATQLEREAVERVWAHYLEVIPSRRRLDDKRRRVIRNALRLVGEDAAKQALLGLSRSPHHNGYNDQHREYLEIRYALKGIGDESDEERIEKAITWAALHAPGNERVDPERLGRWLDEIRYHLEKQATGSQGGRERALEAYRKLRAAGFQIERLEAPPWARVKR